MPPQSFSHYPAIPLPILGQALADAAPHPCNYLPGRTASFRAFYAQSLSPRDYHACMNAGFRRSGRIVYQPTCPACRACIPLRVPVADFRLPKSLRRILRKNADLQITIIPQGPAQPTAEKWRLYQKYQQQWHNKPAAGQEALIDFITFLYDSPVRTVDFEYRTAAGKLIGVGVCDLAPAHSLSSVYFYFDPDESRRSLGGYSAIQEIHYAREHHLPHWYAGYWIAGCSAMAYKSRFRPHELLSTDGVWRPAP